METFQSHLDGVDVSILCKNHPQGKTSVMWTSLGRGHCGTAPSERFYVLFSGIRNYLVCYGNLRKVRIPFPEVIIVNCC